MDRPVLRNYVRNSNMGTLDAARGYRQLSVVLHNDGRAVCTTINLQNHLEDWNTWPQL
ncbi:hypothetical protein SAMN05216289_1741 [Dokdonella immobilis]|uniref:Uncharacterized protein n=2 Tax=Dokdonella immobilis TaxID=578942 RepID=A0A1I5BEJ3_9GAMM|nr:hypothetical protein SAMN05216289_1741 [Dokdonella immobilis]